MTDIADKVDAIEVKVDAILAIVQAGSTATATDLQPVLDAVAKVDTDIANLLSGGIAQLNSAVEAVGAKLESTPPAPPAAG